MGLLDYVAAPRQRVAYLFPEQVGPLKRVSTTRGRGSSVASKSKIEDVFIFQFWPQQVQDNYTPNYATKNIPGASHPLYQWTSGNGRDISFTAQFVSELREDQGVTDSKNTSFLDRIQRSAATDIFPSAADVLGNAFNALMLPSSRYTVNVAAAIAALQQYLYPTYGQDSGGPTAPPRKLVLVLPGTRIGRTPKMDSILCIMRSASVTQEAFFPSGEIRSASVALRFSEIIQISTSSVSKIKYIGAEVYDELAGDYTYTINSGDELTLG